MIYHQKVSRNEKQHKTLAGDELLLLRNWSSPRPSPHFSPLSTVPPPPRPRRPRFRFRFVRPRPRPRGRFVSARGALFRFQCSEKNDTNESFCHSKCPDVHRWTAGVRAIPSLSQDCPNSCGLCGNSTVCMDRDTRCHLYKRRFCRGRLYSYDWKRIFCGRTCGLC
ncbi:hypothetical protein niasHT_007898 [Heterodera trifolii]|uniref:ShKT domain-containing protein n=1 Tax=Heterodera trifolii TaxID=157864 RepID=A0ABD2LZD9_9BILA